MQKSFVKNPYKNNKFHVHMLEKSSHHFFLLMHIQMEFVIFLVNISKLSLHLLRYRTLMCIISKQNYSHTFFENFQVSPYEMVCREYFHKK